MSFLNKINVQPKNNQDELKGPRFIIQLDIDDYENDLIESLEKIFLLFSKLNSETWVIGNIFKPAQNKTKEIIEIMLEKASFDSIQFFIFDNEVKEKGKNYHILDKDRTTHLNMQNLKKLHESIVRSCDSSRNNVDKIVDSKINWRIFEDPYYLKLYNEKGRNELKYELNIKYFNNENAGGVKIKSETKDNILDNYTKLLNSLKESVLKDDVIFDQNDRNLIDHVLENYKKVFNETNKSLLNKANPNSTENSDFLNEIISFDILKKLDIFFNEKLKKLKSSFGNQNQQWDIFDPEKCKKNRLVIKLDGNYLFSVPDFFEKMLEKYENSPLNIFEKNFFTSKKDENKNGPVKYQSFEISKILEKMLSSTIYNSIFLTDTKHKDFILYFINLWLVIFNQGMEADLMIKDPTQNDDEIETDINLLTTYIHSAVYLKEYTRKTTETSSFNINSANATFDKFEENSIKIIEKYKQKKVSKVHNFIKKIDEKNLIHLAILANMKLFLSEENLSIYIRDNTSNWFNFFHILNALSQFIFTVFLMILMIGDPRCNNEVIKSSEESIRLRCFKINSLHYFNTFWVASKIASEILEFFTAPIMFKKYWKINFLEMTGCVLYFIGWSRKFTLDLYYINVFRETDEYRILMCITFVIFMMVLIDYLSFFDYFRVKITILVYMIKEIFSFGIFLVFSIFTFGLVVQVSMFSSGFQYIRTLMRNMVAYGFFPIFGKMDLFDSLFIDENFEKSYSRDECLISKNMTVTDGINCPYRTGVVFSYIGLIVYLILMNLVFINALISTFGNVYEKIQEKSEQIINFESAANYIESRKNGILKIYILIITKICLLPPFSIFLFVLIPIISGFNLCLKYRKRKNTNHNP